MNGIWQTIREIGRLIMFGMAETASLTTWVNKQNRTTLNVYLRSLLAIAGFIILFPMLPLSFRLLGAPGWITAFAGIFLAICTLWLAIIAAPLAIVIDAILHGLKGTIGLFTQGIIGPGKRYVDSALWILLIEAFVFLCMSIIPLKNNPTLVPIILLAALIIVIVGAISKKGDGFKKLAGTLATIMIVGVVLSFFFPKTSEVVTNSVPKIDSAVAKTISGEKTGESESSTDDLVCSDARNIQILPGTTDTTIVVSMSLDCYTGWITIPKGVKFRTQSSTNKGYDVLFRDGHKMSLRPDDNKDMGKHTSSFRVKGEGDLHISIVH